MGLRLKRVGEQVVVVTGASSGIGLVTAKMAARRGARVVLAARNEAALARAVDDIVAAGGQAAYAVADVSSERDVEHVAAVAVREFGGFDTWVNDASVAIYGRVMEVSTDDIRRLFDVNFFGVVHGSRVAVEHFRERFGGRGAADHDAPAGAIVNVGSALSDRAVPLLGLYAAAKHAVKAFTDALRMDLEHEGLPVSVSLVKPASIDTPFYEHARNYMAAEPEPIPPVYAPELAAEVILACAERPHREVVAGGGAKAMQALGHYAPGLADHAMQALYGVQTRHREPTHDGDGNLYRPLDGAERGRYRGRVLESSVTTTASLNPAITAAAALGIGAALVAGARFLRGRHTGTVEVQGSAGDDDDDDPDAPASDAVGGAQVADSAESAQHAPGGSRYARPEITPRTDVDVEL